MTAKNIFGYVFIVISILLLFMLIGLLPSVLTALFAFFQIFTGTLDSYGVGYAIGSFVTWTLYVVAMIYLWKYGRRWTRKQNASAGSNESHPQTLDWPPNSSAGPN
jgi:hypothetical protein